jgi:hypothetical protein
MEQLPSKYMQYCLAITHGLFADMLNPKFRGDNFTWENFPKMAKDWGLSSICLAFTNVNEKRKRMIGEKCESIAKDILERSDICSWSQK